MIPFGVRGRGLLGLRIRFLNYFEVVASWLAYALGQGVSESDFNSWLAGSLDLPIMVNTTAYVDEDGGIYLDSQGRAYYAIA
jgi:hypothetical protein